MLEITKKDVQPEKYIILGCIYDELFCIKLNQTADTVELLKSREAKNIVKFCFEYYSDYSTNCGNNIQVFLDSNTDEKTEMLLKSVMEMYDKSFNFEYYFDICFAYLRKRKLEIFNKEISVLINEDSIKDAENKIAEYNKLQKNVNNYIDILNDDDGLINSFTYNKLKLFRLHGKFGELLKDFHRGDLVGVGAPQKRGKTWMLMYFAIQAMLRGYKVGYWTLEMDAELMRMRINQALTGYPKYETAIKLPFIDDNELYHRCFTKKGIELENALSVTRKLRRQLKSGGLYVFDMSTGGCTVSDMEATLKNAEYYDNKCIDILIADYADIMEAENPKLDYRNQLNSIWKGLKVLAEERKILVITASQLDRSTLSGKGGTGNIAEDIRKFSHVSHWITLLQTAEEKEAGVMRTTVEGRHDYFSSKELVLLQNLSIGRPVLDSIWKKDIKNYDSFIKASEDK